MATTVENKINTGTLTKGTRVRVLSGPTAGITGKVISVETPKPDVHVVAIGVRINGRDEVYRELASILEIV